SLVSIYLFFFCCHGAPRVLHSFPTRRSSDLETAVASVAGAPSTAGAAASSTSRMTLRPASTSPVATVIARMRSRLVTSTCVSRRSEEHTSELQSRFDLVCRLLLEKKKTQKTQ